VEETLFQTLKELGKTISHHVAVCGAAGVVLVRIQLMLAAINII
jgi:hypothetical protein